MVELFLSRLTQSQLQQSASGAVAELACCSPDSWIDPKVAAERIEEARRRFGAESDPTARYSNWTVSESMLGAAIEFALDNERLERRHSDPVRLHFYYRFNWLQFDALPYTINPAEIRDPRSLLAIYLGARELFIQPSFTFPAPWTSEYLKEFLCRIEPDLPFRLRDNCFQRWIPSATGKSRSGRILKLAANWRRPEALQSA